MGRLIAIIMSSSGMGGGGRDWWKGHVRDFVLVLGSPQTEDLCEAIGDCKKIDSRTKIEFVGRNTRLESKKQVEKLVSKQPTEFRSPGAETKKNKKTKTPGIISSLITASGAVS